MAGAERRSPIFEVYKQVRFERSCAETGLFCFTRPLPVLCAPDEGSISQMTKKKDLGQPGADFAVIPWRVWANNKGISIDTANRLRAAGKAPRLTHISERRFGVTVADDREWTQARQGVRR
jgi:hypothetical protein